MLGLKNDAQEARLIQTALKALPIIGTVIICSFCYLKQEESIHRRLVNPNLTERTNERKKQHNKHTKLSLKNQREERAEKERVLARNAQNVRNMQAKKKQEADKQRKAEYKVLDNERDAFFKTYYNGNGVKPQYDGSKIFYVNEKNPKTKKKSDPIKYILDTDHKITGEIKFKPVGVADDLVEKKSITLERLIYAAYTNKTNCCRGTIIGKFFGGGDKRITIRPAFGAENYTPRVYLYPNGAVGDDNCFVTKKGGLRDFLKKYLKLKDTGAKEKNDNETEE